MRLIRCSLSLIALLWLGSTEYVQYARAAATQISPPVPDGFRIAHWRTISDLRWSIAQFDTVFWDPRDTPSLRDLIRTNGIARNRRVLEIGVGTGLLSLCSLEQGATRALGTDINPAAAACARYNAARFGWQDKFDCRLVTKTNAAAFAVIKPGEKFDLILSNPPWVDRRPKSDFEFALYDPGFELLKSLLEGLPQHLNPDGQVFLAYGSVSGIRTLQKLGAQLGYTVRIVNDDRRLEDLPEEFLPGMTLEVIVPASLLR